MAGVGKILKQAQKMQRSIEALQAELEARELEVTAGGGAVKVKVSVAGKFLSLSLDPEFLKEEPAIRKSSQVGYRCQSLLAEQVKSGRFREDLFYRLNVIAVTLPGLRDRPADLKRLAEGARRYFASRTGKAEVEFSPEVLAAFATYPWPGNLRELRNVIERAVILAPSKTIELADLPEEFAAERRPAMTVGARITLDELEAEHIRRILAASRNLDDAARALGIDPATLYRKRSKLGLL